MLVFIDESGDAGFNLDRGASSVFVVAMVIFADGEAAAQTQRAIEVGEARKIHRPEFKFSKCSDDVRDAFFRDVRACPFIVRAVAVQKVRIRSERLRADKRSFHEYFVHQMLRHDGGRLVGARIVIDGSGDREFRQRLRAALRGRLAGGTIRDVRFKDSGSDLLVQLADMCVGAVARSYRLDKTEPDRWLSMLAPRIDDIRNY